MVLGVWAAGLTRDADSITLDDEDFESIDLLVRNLRKPPRPQPHHTHQAARRRVLSTAGVLAICFFCVSPSCACFLFDGLVLTL